MSTLFDTSGGQSSGPLLARYMAGEHEAVWVEMMNLGEGVRSPRILPDALAVAEETMRRVRDNVRIVHERLTKAGYALLVPHAAHILPTAQTRRQVNLLEQRFGLLPLSLKVFYEIVGTVDFRQSWEQVRHPHLGGRIDSEVQVLGEEDPLVVWPITETVADWDERALDRDYSQLTGTGAYLCFAPDEFHKADISGGENYHVRLPDPRADFEIQGMYGIDELFVQYLRESFRNGGFRGRAEPMEEDQDRARKVPPQLRVCTELASGLLPL